MASMLTPVQFATKKTHAKAKERRVSLWGNFYGELAFPQTRCQRFNFHAPLLLLLTLIYFSAATIVVGGNANNVVETNLTSTEIVTNVSQISAYSDSKNPLSVE